MRITNYLFLSLILFFSACSNSANPDQYLITGVNVIDIETGNISENQSILINKNEIADIFEDGAKSPDVFETIAMEGKYVIPGLWDMHIHLRGGQELVPSNRSLLPMYLASGVTSVRDAGGDLTPSIFDWQSQIEAGSLEGPDIYTSGPKIDGPDPTWEGSIEVVNSEEISAALDSLESIGVDYVKIYESTLSGEAYLEIIRQAEERGLTVTGHMPMMMPFPKVWMALSICITF